MFRIMREPYENTGLNITSEDLLLYFILFIFLLFKGCICGT